MITITGYEEAREAFRHRNLRQALYDEGVRLMDGVIVNLHGEPHIARRRLENRLFRRDTFAWYESERIPAIIDEVLAPALAEGRGDLPSLARRTMMTLSIDVAGVDRPSGDTGEIAGDQSGLERFFELMDALARASTVAHATGEKEAIKAEGDRALADFDREFYQGSLARRQALVDAVRRGEAAEADLPRDVLTTLLVNHDRLDLPDDTVLREVAYYPWVGSHSTANHFVHAMHHLFRWFDEHPGSRAELTAGGGLRQRFVHESMRLHPASPVALRRPTGDVELTTGRILPEGELVMISVEQANRDPEAVGSDPDRFDPFRVTADGVPPWGLSFGSGTHVCLGRELAGGLGPDEAIGHELLGAAAVMAGVVLEAGVRPDPDDPPTDDETTTRQMFGRYPVLFDR
ncbi:MAG: cytochrome P450 [Acidimicrobiales bacterium]